MAWAACSRHIRRPRHLAVLAMALPSRTPFSDHLTTACNSLALADQRLGIKRRDRARVVFCNLLSAMRSLHKRREPRPQQAGSGQPEPIPPWPGPDDNDSRWRSWATPRWRRMRSWPPPQEPPRCRAAAPPRCRGGGGAALLVPAALPLCWRQRHGMRYQSCWCCSRACSRRRCCRVTRACAARAMPQARRPRGRI